MTGIPLVFDTHHFECYKLLHKDETFLDASEYIPIILETWKPKGIKPKFHVSEQGSGRIGHHSDYIEILPEYLLEIPTSPNDPKISSPLVATPFIFSFTINL